MTNYTNIMEVNYNLTKIIDPTAVTDTVTWVGAFNNEVGGWIIMTLLVVLGIVLFLNVRKIEDVSDAKAGMYSGFVISLVGMFLFLVSMPLDPGTKILTWAQYVPILVVTGIMIFVYKANRLY